MTDDRPALIPVTVSDLLGAMERMHLPDAAGTLVTFLPPKPGYRIVVVSLWPPEVYYERVDPPVLYTDKETPQ